MKILAPRLTYNFIPAPAYCLHSKKVYSVNGRRKYISLVMKSEMKLNKKYKMHDFKYETKMKTINNQHPRARFIIISNNSIVFTLWK